jgi:hypothetical protein
VKQYLLSVYQPDGDPPAPEILGKVMQAVGAWNTELKTAGAWVFTAGLYPPDTAVVLEPSGDDVLSTDGPFVEGKEHIGGFTIIKAADLDAALRWGRELARVTTLPIEVRPLRDQAP